MLSSSSKTRILSILLAVLFTSAGCSGGSGSSDTRPANAFYATKTPYAPEQDLSSYEPAPAGYGPVFTQMLARHGARALTSANDIEYIKQLIDYAAGDGALTDLGSELRVPVSSLEEANVALGYGNLSGLGVEEHQDLAARLLARQPELFRSAASKKRHVMVVSSGKDRAVDSGNNFAASLATHAPALAPFIEPPVTNTHLLYFFAEDKPYQDWLANDPALNAKLDQIFYSERSHREAHGMLSRLFSAEFVDKLASGKFSFKNPKTGGTIVLNEVDLAVSLYNLYQIAPGLSKEGTWDFARFVPAAPAQWFAYVSDAGQFYEKGPSFAGNAITFEMARVLQDDFFNEVKAYCSHDGAFVADLRFAHAETIIPLAALMQLPYSDQQVASSGTYNYDDNTWRGALVSPYAANIQWDAYTNDAGDCLVRMLYNEKQMRFKAACTSIRPASYYYKFDELKRCYGYQ